MVEKFVKRKEEVPQKTISASLSPATHGPGVRLKSLNHTVRFYHPCLPGPVPWDGSGLGALSARFIILPAHEGEKLPPLALLLSWVGSWASSFPFFHARILGFQIHLSTWQCKPILFNQGPQSFTLSLFWEKCPSQVPATR